MFIIWFIFYETESENQQQHIENKKQRTKLTTICNLIQHSQWITATTIGDAKMIDITEDSKIKKQKQNRNKQKTEFDIYSAQARKAQTNINVGCPNPLKRFDF